MEIDTEICENISLKSVQDSNLFLRKLWSELGNCNGRNFCPSRDANRIYIGFCNYGIVSFDYKKRGCINNIYFSQVKNRNMEYVQKAIIRAKKIEEINTYYVKIELPFLINDMIENKVYTMFIKENNKSYLFTKINAYSIKDLKYLLKKKIEVLRALFSVYIRDVFPLNLFKVSYSNEKQPNFEFYEEKYSYNLDWIDLDEIPKSEKGYYIIPKEMLILADTIMHTNFYSRQISMLINSAHLFYSATYQMKLSEENEEDLIGCVNIANSMVISALEPLADLENVPKSVCEKCGTPLYSVIKKMKILLSRYSDPATVKCIMDTYYSNRSKFFHEGARNTEEYYIGVCWPQIDEQDGRSILTPHSIIAYNLFDWVNYIIRKRIYDIVDSL